MSLAALCAYCDEAVTAQDVVEHMAVHDMARPDEWRFHCWPDGGLLVLGDDPAALLR